MPCSLAGCAAGLRCPIISQFRNAPLIGAALSAPLGGSLCRKRLSRFQSAAEYLSCALKSGESLSLTCERGDDKSLRVVRQVKVYVCIFNSILEVEHTMSSSAALVILYCICTSTCDRPLKITDTVTVCTLYSDRALYRCRC